MALVGYAGFLVVVFAVRTDPSSWVRFTSRADAVAGTVLVAALAASFASLHLVLLDRLRPWTSGPATALGGGVLMVAGAVMALSAQGQLGPAWRPGIDPKDQPLLITDGLYHRSRNPFYVGWVLVAAGVTVLSLTPLTIAGLVGLVVSLEIVVRWVEEPALRAALGQAFVEYERRTRRFV